MVLLIETSITLLPVLVKMWLIFMQFYNKCASDYQKVSKDLLIFFVTLVSQFHQSQLVYPTLNQLAHHW